MATPFLMYHELEREGAPVCDTDPGYFRYVLRESTFAGHLAWMSAEGFRGAGVTDALATGLGTPGTVVLTFDDGCESDWLVAAPLLKDRGFGATFYAVSQWLGRRPGVMSPAQLRQLSEAGFEIGSHSATHAFLTELEDAALVRELAGSKHAIEDIIGAAVRQLSCPGGRWSPRVAKAALEAGYDGVATSRLGVNGPVSDRYALARCAMLRDAPASTIAAICRGEGFGRARARERVLNTAKVLLGNRLYCGFRSRVLRHT